MGLVLALLLALWLSRGIAEPLRRITLAARDLAQGRTPPKTAPGTDDELGQLGRAFDDMAVHIRSLLGGLAKERDRVRAILEAVSAGLFAINRDGDFELANEPARGLLGMPASGARLDQLEAAALREAAQEALSRSSRGETEPVVLDVDLAASGRVVLARLTPQPLSGGVVGILQDITEIRDLESMRRDLVSNVSHELRTPVTSILGYLEALRDGLAPSEEERQRYLGIIEDEARRLSRLVEDLFDLSKLESGQAGLRLVPLDLASLARDVARKVAIAAATGGVALEVAAPDVLPFAGDPDRLAQVLLNLLDNAIRFTPSGGSVRLEVGACEDADEARLVVRDTGPGIEPEDLPHVFDRFYTGDKSRARPDGNWRTSGTGLGLVIVR